MAIYCIYPVVSSSLPYCPIKCLGLHTEEKLSVFTLQQVAVSQYYYVYSVVSVPVYLERDRVMCLWPLGFRPNSGTSCKRQCRLGGVWRSVKGGGSEG